MEHLFVVLALALTLLMLLTACRGKVTPTLVPTPALPYIEDVKAALLTMPDLPAGWTALPVQTSNELSTLPCGQALPDVRTVVATATFETANGGHVSESIAAFHTGEAETWLTALRSGSACSAVNEGDYEGTPIVAHVTHPADRGLGDQSFALRLTTDGPPATFETDIVYVRMGDFILQVGDTTVGGADPNLTATIVDKAILDFQAARLTP